MPIYSTNLPLVSCQTMTTVSLEPIEIAGFPEFDNVAVTNVEPITVVKAPLLLVVIM